MDKITTQIATEIKYNRKTVWDRIDNEISREPELMECIFQATQMITNWAVTFDGYDSKRNRLDKLLAHNQIGAIVRQAAVLVLMLDDTPDLITSLAGQLASSIKGMDTHKDQVVTAGEMLTLMCDADMFDMYVGVQDIEDEETGVMYVAHSWFIKNPWELTDATVKHIKRSMYLPPMIIPPQPLKHNKSTGYYSLEQESLILGKGNHHDGDICLESLERFNDIPLALNEKFLKSVDNLMDTTDMSHETEMQYKKFMEDSYFVFAYLIKNGNRWYLTHKPDKRGRTYAQGYHCSTQGNAFRKGAVDLADKEKVTGDFL